MTSGRSRITVAAFMWRRIPHSRRRPCGAAPLLAAALPLLAALLLPPAAFAKVTDDTIVLGAAVSLTGRYTTAGNHTRKGYDLAVKMINERGGVRVAGAAYRLEILYYDDVVTLKEESSKTSIHLLIAPD